MAFLSLNNKFTHFSAALCYVLNAIILKQNPYVVNLKKAMHMMHGN